MISCPSTVSFFNSGLLVSQRRGARFNFDLTEYDTMIEMLLYIRSHAGQLNFHLDARFFKNLSLTNTGPFEDLDGEYDSEHDMANTQERRLTCGDMMALRRTQIRCDAIIRRRHVPRADADLSLAVDFVFLTVVVEQHSSRRDRLINVRPQDQSRDQGGCQDRQILPMGGGGVVRLSAVWSQMVSGLELWPH